jgi:hypothetical protein
LGGWNGMKVFAIVIFVVFAILLSVLQVKRHKRKITEQIHSIGGEVISIKKQNFSPGPFIIVGRGRTVYRIEYIKNSEVKYGWVKFGDLFGPDWRI